MTREELIEIVKKVRQAEGSEDEIDKLMDKFESNVPDPNAGNYLILISTGDSKQNLENFFGVKEGE